jgi:hypothetical protein
MIHETQIELLQNEWSPEEGFFWQIRQGRFEPAAFQRAHALVSAIVMNEATAPRRVVSLLWSIPLFMHDQADRIREAGGDIAAYDLATTRMTSEVERLLGMP